MTYIARGLRRVGGVKIPDILWKYTTRRIITMEFLNGLWLSNDAHSLSQAERAHASSLLFQAFLFTIFELGYFNADMHKGNLCVLPDGRVGMVDFGITGFASQRTRLRHLGLVAAFQKGAVDEAFASILEIVFVPPDADLGAFKRLFEQEYYDWFLRSVQPNFPAYRRGAGSLMLALFRRAYECRIVVDSDVVRYYHFLDYRYNDVSHRDMALLYMRRHIGRHNQRHVHSTDHLSAGAARHAHGFQSHPPRGIESQDARSSNCRSWKFRSIHRPTCPAPRPAVKTPNQTHSRFRGRSKTTCQSSARSQESPGD